MKHRFTFSKEFVRDLEAELQHRLSHLEFARLGNEPNYNPAFIQALHGVEIKGPREYVRIDGTAVIGTSRNAAETWSGADMAITATITSERVSVRKAVLIQAKVGRVEDLSAQERERLLKQIDQMRHYNRSPKVLEISKDRELPTIVSATGMLRGNDIRHFRFDRWFCSKMLTTRHGDTRPHFVDAVQNAKLDGLRVLAHVEPR